jgi:transposase InsO family protein
VLDKWAYEINVELDFSRPGKPTDNPFIESFNGSFRDECLYVNWFLSMEDAQGNLMTGKRIITILDHIADWETYLPMNTSK